MRSKSSYDYKNENKSKIQPGSLQCTNHSTVHAHKDTSIFFSPCFIYSYIHVFLSHVDMLFHKEVSWLGIFQLIRQILF